MNKKVSGIIFLAVIIIAVSLCFVKNYYDNRSIKSFSAVMCSANDFYTSGDSSYLEIVLDDEKHTVKKIAMKDENVLKKISEASLQEIIGVNIASDIPKKVLEESHFNSDIDDFNPLQLLTETDKYDNFFEIVDVSFSDIQNSAE